MKLSNHKLNPEKLSGIWYDYEVGEETARFLIAREKKPAYQNSLLKILDDIEAEKRLNPKATQSTLLTKQAARVCDLLAEHILLDWAGLKDEAGQDIPYSRILARELVDSNKFPEIAEFIAAKSRDVDAYKGEKLAEDVEAAKKK